MSGKTVIPFATSRGSGIGNVDTYLGESAKGAVFANAKCVSALAEASEIEARLNAWRSAAGVIFD